MNSFRRALAKTNRKSPDSPDFQCLSLRGHAIDAAAAARALLKGNTRKSFEAAIGKPLSEGDIERLCVLTGLHDVGKTLLGFRTKIEGGKVDNEYFGCHVRPLMDQVVIAKRGLERLPSATRHFFEASGLLTVCSWYSTAKEGLSTLRILFSHHGGCRKPPMMGTTNPFSKQLNDYHGSSASQEAAYVFEALRELFPLAFQPNLEPIPNNELFSHLFLGLVETADWLASTVRRKNGHQIAFDLSGDDFTSEERYTKALATADSILQECGFHSPFERTHVTSPEHVVGGHALRPLQKAVLDVPVFSKICGIEAPTGEGKTEAALIRFFKLYEAGLVDGLYFAVPTRSAGFDLFSRVEKLMNRLHPQASQSVLAVPGLQDFDNSITEGEISWASENGNFLMSSLAVGTVDQLLLSGIRARNCQQKAFASSRLFLVIDEVHSFDPVMISSLTNVMRKHVALGGYTTVLSATLGNVGFSELVGTPLLPFEEAKKVPYPIIWHGSSFNSLTTSSFEADGERRKQITLTHGSDIDAIAKVKQAVDAGAKVLVILSTVSRAREFQSLLEAAGVPTLSLTGPNGSVNVMHHGRYALQDRRNIDRSVLRVLGTESGDKAGVAVVGTQSVEQSLNICADYLVTDLCPMEVLLQRLGRLFRVLRLRPLGFETPHAFIIDPANPDDWLTDDGKAITRHLPQLNVYRNALQLEATRQLISECSSIVIPDDNRVLVEMATHPERLRKLAENLGPKWLMHLDRLTGLNDSEDAKAKKMLLRWNVYPDEECNLLPDNMNDIYTRLGCDTISVRTDFISFSGEHIVELSVRANELKSISKNMVARVVETSAEETVLVVGGSMFRYDRKGLRRFKYG